MYEEIAIDDAVKRALLALSGDQDSNFTGIEWRETRSYARHRQA